MKNKSDKMMLDLNRMLNSMDFKSEKELQAFLDKIMENGEIPSFPNEVLNQTELAQDLVYEAYNLHPKKAKEKIEKALTIDIDCIEAYEFLGTNEKSIPIAKVFFEKGVEIGRRIFGGKYLKNNKGHFWGLHETRPFMRCLQHTALCLYNLDKIKESINLLEEIIELNPNDNQGVRDYLMLYLIEVNDAKKFKKYEKMYEEYEMSFACYNKALFYFLNEGETDQTHKLLLDAITSNKHVPAFLLSNKILNIDTDYYSPGDKSEASYYAMNAQHVWQKIDGALPWLKKHAKHI